MATKKALSLRNQLGSLQPYSSQGIKPKAQSESCFMLQFCLPLMHVLSEATGRHTLKRCFLLLRGDHFRTRTVNHIKIIKHVHSAAVSECFVAFRSVLIASFFRPGPKTSPAIMMS